METHWETGRKVIVLENKVIISMIISKTYTEIESLGCLKGLFNIDKLYHTIKKKIIITYKNTVVGVYAQPFLIFHTSE